MNKLEKLKSMSLQLNGKYQLVTDKLRNFEAELSQHLPDINVGGYSVNVTLEHATEDEWTYGYMYFSDGQLQVASRSTYDDYADAMDKIPEEHRSFNCHKIYEIPNEWKIALANDKILDSLISSIERNLAMELDSAERASTSLVNLFNAETEHIDNSVKELLGGNEHLLRQWIKAKASVYTDPAESITRSSSYLESVCRLVLESKGAALPKTKDMTNLINAAVNEINLSTYPEETNDVKKLISGVKSMFSAIGAVRTHAGTAHGSSSTDLDPDVDLAMLVNNSAAAVSIFLLNKSKA
ncbi:abortive infection family protein [Vibrio alginolyticus]|nr:abortive infection family protein [Vibrio alginolyticus]